MHYREGHLVISPTISVHYKSCLGATKVLPRAGWSTMNIELSTDICGYLPRYP